MGNTKSEPSINPGLWVITAHQWWLLSCNYLPLLVGGRWQRKPYTLGTWKIGIYNTWNTCCRFLQSGNSII